MTALLLMFLAGLAMFPRVVRSHAKADAAARLVAEAEAFMRGCRISRGGAE